MENNINKYKELIEDYIILNVTIPCFKGFNYIINDVEDIKVSYPAEDIIIVSIVIWEKVEMIETYSMNQIDNVLKGLKETDKLLSLFFENCIESKSLSPYDEFSYKFTYCLNFDKFKKDNKWKSIKAIKKYNL